MIDRGLPHSSHWGAFSVLARGREIEVVPHPDDPEPSALLGNIPAAVSHRARIARPMVRRGWLEQGPSPDERRGRDEVVAVSWSRALDLVAAELRRCYAEYGPRAIFGGSYGWASAGRFHDAQSQIHRFLNLAGGYVRSVNSYSSGGPGGWEQCQLARAGKPECAGARLRRNGAEEQRCRRRRHEPAYCPRTVAPGPRPGDRIPPHRPDTRRFAGRDQCHLAA